jgi:hypothetical protein
VGSWSKDACCTRQRGYCWTPADGVGYCYDERADDDFIFKLEPGIPMRFGATGNDAYQYISTTHFPVWGGNLDSVPADLSLGSNNDRGTTPECNGQGHAYMGSPFQICGDFDQQGDHLHTAVVHHNDWEVWRLADAK